MNLCIQELHIPNYDHIPMSKHVNTWIHLHYNQDLHSKLRCNSASIGPSNFITDSLDEQLLQGCQVEWKGLPLGVNIKSAVRNTVEDLGV